MGNEKLLKLGGIESSPSWADQNPGRFLIAHNFYKTIRNKIRPRPTFGQLEDAELPSTTKDVLHLTSFKNNRDSNEIISVICEVTGTYPNSTCISTIRLYSFEISQNKIPYNFSPIQGPYNNIDGFNVGNSGNTANIQSLKNNNTLYILNAIGYSNLFPFFPTDNSLDTNQRVLLKYDGVQLTYAGVRQPVISNIIPGGASNSGTKFLRFVQHRLDFDYNEPASDYVQVPVLATNLTPTFGLGGINNIITDGAIPNATPDTITRSSVFGDSYFVAVVGTYLYRTAVVDYIAKTITLTAPTSRTGTANNTATITSISTSGLKEGMKVEIAGIGIRYISSFTPGSTTIVLNEIVAFTGTVTLSFPFDTNMGNMVGAYVICDIGAKPTAVFGYKRLIRDNFTEIGPSIGIGVTNYLGLAAKVISASASTMVFDSSNIKFLNVDRVWVTVDITDGHTRSLLPPNLPLQNEVEQWIVDEGNPFARGSSNMVSVWASNSSSGIYNFQAFNLAFPDSPYTYPTAFNVANPPVISTSPYPASSALVNISNTLDSWYDVTSQKVSFNAKNAFDNSPSFTTSPITGIVEAPSRDLGFFGMTIYQNQLLVCNKELIWLSDATNGGSFEMTNTLSFIAVGDTQFGPITAICATPDFFVVSRRYRMYYVSGNITTGNYRVQEIPDINEGVVSNDCMISVRGLLYCLTPKGVFVISPGGSATDVSAQLLYSVTSWDENDTPVYKGNPSDFNFGGDRYTCSYDSYKNAILFINQNETQQTGRSVLYLELNSMEFYTWGGISDPSIDQGNVFCVGTHRSAGSLPLTLIGTRGLTRGDTMILCDVPDQYTAVPYFSRAPAQLYTTWIALGEPSLEKIFLQLKMLGFFSKGDISYSFLQGSSVDINYYKDWDLSNKISCGTYDYDYDNSVNNNSVKYYHKKRINSDKIMAISVGIEISDDTIWPMGIQLESLEMEVNPIQLGMKK